MRERANKSLRKRAKQAELIAYLQRSREEVDRLRRELNDKSSQLERERTELRGEWVERQRSRIAELEKNFAAAIKQHETATERAIAEVKDRELRAQLEKQGKRGAIKARTAARDDADAAVLQQLSESQADLGPAAAPVEKPVEADRLVPGARVRVKGFPSPVVVRRLDSRSAEIEAGSLRMKIPISDIIAIVEESTKKSPVRSQPSVSVSARPGDEPSTQEINVIGCTVEEASRRVDKFVDQAAVNGLSRIRVIHGHGTGALRRGLSEFLSAHPLVERTSSEAEERGGAAITIVELKD